MVFLPNITVALSELPSCADSLSLFLLMLPPSQKISRKELGSLTKVVRSSFIFPITEALLQEEAPSDSVMQVQFKIMINNETEKCKRVVGSPNYDRCRSFAIAYAVKKFLYKYSPNSILTHN